MVILEAFASIFVVSGIIAVAIRRIDRTSIATPRRIFGMLFIASLVWLVTYSLGSLYPSNSQNPSTNAFIVGGFMAAGLELLVINGVFLRSTAWSMPLSILHPLPMALLLYSTLKPTSHIPALVTGSVIFLVVFAFLLRIGRFQTQHHNIGALNLLQAFLKTWTSKNPEELERYFTVYAQPRETVTTLAKFVTPNIQIVALIPSIHPGPFYPVGSYNLSEVIYHQFRQKGILALVMHGTGGHERNLPSNRLVHEYTEQVTTFAEKLPSSPEKNLFRGPVRTTFKQTTATCIGFDNEALLLISNAPYNSDDIDPSVVEEITKAADESDFAVSVVDAHNSIGGENAPGLKATAGDWTEIFTKLRSANVKRLSLGYSHSSEVEFLSGSDVGDGGIGVLVFDTGDAKNMLIVADANNVIAGLRGEIARMLNKNGFELLEVCTSDTHSLAARTITKRGYSALGEATPKDRILEAVVDLATLANNRLGACQATISAFSFSTTLVGAEPLSDFAIVTNKAIAFSKNFIKGVAIPILLLIVVTAILF